VTGGLYTADDIGISCGWARGDALEFWEFEGYSELNPVQGIALRVPFLTPRGDIRKPRATPWEPYPYGAQ